MAIVLTDQLLTSRPSGSGVRLSAAPLGLNVGPWDGVYPDSADVIQPLLSAAGIRQLRYGGGSSADYYDWQTNTDIEKCLPDNASAAFTARCAATDFLDFAQFSRYARAIGADSFVTVNYGSGTPAEAAAWVTKAADTAGEQVALWEVGNEAYGCWEVDNELAGAPEHYRGFKPSSNGAADNSTCPQVAEGDAAGTQTLAASYSINAKRFLVAMKMADSSAQIGVPWAFGAAVQGSELPDSAEWNNAVLKADGKYISFVDAHYYPLGYSGSTGGYNPTDRRVLQSLRQIPSLYKSIRTELHRYAPSASVVIGETAVSNHQTTTGCTPAGALFAAGDVLSWLAAGAESVNWWDMNNYGNITSRCVKPDYGFFTSSSPPVTETSYDGYLLASVLAQPHAQLGRLSTSDPSDVLAFQSVLTNGRHAVAFINMNTSGSRTVGFATAAGLTGNLLTLSYSAGVQNANNSRVVTGTRSASSIGARITLPRESITVLETQ
jgi:hypothetical protein